MLHALGSRHDIEVLTTYHHADPVDGLPLEVVDQWNLRPGPTNKRQQAWLQLTAREPAFAWGSRGRIEPLRAAIRRRRPDLVHMMLGELAPALDAATAPTSLLLIDSYTRHAEAALAVETMPRRRALLRAELVRCRRFERRWYRQADSIACVSDVDAATLTELLDRSVDVLPNPIAPAFFDHPTGTRAKALVLFVGSMGYPPNIDALEWLVRDIWPAVMRLRPDAELLAVGRSNDDPTVVSRLQALLGGRLLLDVPDIREFYWRAAVAVAPVRLGGGMKNKILHAMASSCPVVSTSAAVSGIGAQHGEHLLCADDADAFARAIANVLDEPDAAQARAARAGAFVERFQTDRVANDVERWWELTAGQAPVRA